MGTVKLNPELQAFLTQLKDKTELQDSDGNLIGLFTPKEQAEAELVEEAKQAFDFEDAERRLATEKRYTTAEVLEHLKSLESAE